MDMTKSEIITKSKTNSEKKLPVMSHRLLLEMCQFNPVGSLFMVVNNSIYTHEKLLENVPSP